MRIGELSDERARELRGAHRLAASARRIFGYARADEAGLIQCANEKARLAELVSGRALAKRLALEEVEAQRLAKRVRTHARGLSFTTFLVLHQEARGVAGASTAEAVGRVVSVTIDRDWGESDAPFKPAAATCTTTRTLANEEDASTTAAIEGTAPPSNIRSAPLLSQDPFPIFSTADDERASPPSLVRSCTPPAPALDPFPSH